MTKLRGCMAVYPNVQALSRWVEVINRHPNIDFECRMIADEKDFKFLNEYDFVYLYVLPVGKVGNWWWYDLPEAVRKDFNGMIVLHFDYEGIMYKLPPFLKESINANVDVLGYTSPHVVNNWGVNIPKFPLMMVDKVEDIENKVEPNVNRDGVGLMWHAGTLCRIDESLALCVNKGYNIKTFTAWIGMNKPNLERFVESIIGKYPLKTCYPYMDYDDYLYLLNKCRVFLDDNTNYYGPSRVSYECASLHIPVVCSTNNYFSVAYPYTTTNPSNVQLQTQLITRLLTEKDFNDKVVNYAYNKMKGFFSDEESLNRFVRVLEELGLM